jgi:RNA polymerase sigma-70 factor (ECF subfamily)
MLAMPAAHGSTMRGFRAAAGSGVVRALHALGNFSALPGFIILVNHVSVASNPAGRWCLDPPIDSDTPVRISDDDDASVLAHAVGGDQQAWQQLFDRWKKPLLAFFYRSLGSMPESEDLTLEVFVRLHRAGPRYEHRAAFATYLFHIARNLLLNELRRRRRKPAQPLPPEAFDHIEAPGADSARRTAELEEVFQRALTQLPEAQRTLLLLIQQQGLDQATVARLLAVTENALRVQLHRARERLKELMTISP